VIESAADTLGWYYPLPQTGVCKSHEHFKPTSGGGHAVKKSPKFPFQEIAHRLTGFSTPVFGISWNPSKSKRDIVFRLVTFLEDRRALYAPFDMENGASVVRSVQDMRAELTRALQDSANVKELSGPIRAMRAACRKFLTETGPDHSGRHGTYQREANMWQALGELRGVFGFHLAQLCSAFGVDVERELAGTFPEADED
jgi:hypothetical protein